MLSLLWWLPMAVAVAAALVLWWGVRVLHDEASRLQASITELAQVRPQVARLRGEIAAVDAARRGLHDTGHR
jgi:hypothetical protein